jgi:hypothetical protein
MTLKEKKEQRVEEIKELLAPFALEYLDEEAYGFTLKLLSQLSRKRTLDICKGKKEVWAGAVVYAIARLNFLFDKEQDYWITADELADFFQIKKSTVSQKATRIEDACDIGFMDKRYTRSRISSKFQYIQLASGFIVPAETVDQVAYQFSPECPEEVDAYELFLAAKEKGELKPPRSVAWQAEKVANAKEKRINQEKAKEEKRLAREERDKLAAEEAERKRIAYDKIQPNLFDLD